MKILLTGATGFIGGYILREALRRDHEVIAMVRQNRLPTGGEFEGYVEAMKFELGGEERLDVSGYNLDAIVHLAASLDGDNESNRRTLLDGSRQLVEAAMEANVQTLVCVSSVAVVDYASIPAMSVIDENAPLVCAEGNDGSYAILKSRQEAIVEQFCTNEDSQLVILRPGLVYDGGTLSSAHAGLVKSKFAVMVSHSGSVPVIEVETLAATAIDAVEMKGTGKKIFQLVDDNLPSQSRYIAELRRRDLLQSNCPTVPWRVLSVLATVCRSIATMLGAGHRLPELLTSHGFAGRLKPFRFANAKARQAFERTYKGGF